MDFLPPTRIPERPADNLITRREFCASTLAAAAGAALAGCASTSGPDGSDSRLTARAAAPTGTIDPGLTTVGAPREGLLYVPTSYDPASPVALVLALHGAGGTADGPIDFLIPYADAVGFIVLAVDSRSSTWDAIRSRYGPDVTVIDRSLRHTFERCAIAPERVFIEGFSDGASYALGLGLANGDLFAGVVAFSPGFIPSGGTLVGEPRIFVSHGTQDTVLPIEVTSRRLVADLRAAGYAVTYEEFEGGHEVPAAIAQAGIDWMVGA